MGVSLNRQEEYPAMWAIAPFRSNAHFLEAKLQEYLLFIERSLLAGKMRKLARIDGTGSGSPAYRKASALFQKRTDEYSAIREKNRAMLASTTDEVFPFTELSRNCALDDNAQHILWLLFFNSMASEFTELCKNSAVKDYYGESKRALSIGDLVRAISPESFEAQLLLCRYFGLSSPLMRAHLLDLETYAARSFLDIEVSLPARVVNHIAADETEYDADSSFIIERPDVPLAFVILPEEQKKRVLMFVENYEKAKRKHKELAFDKVLSYGRGLIILLYGPSGTGKTLFAKAIAAYTGKPLLSTRTGKKGEIRDYPWGRLHSEDIGELFREARMRNGIVFLDECEQVCKKESGMVYEVLREIENADTIVIMTTNVPYALAEPLDRRITLKVLCDVPSAALRREIWENHLPATVPLADDVDLDALAQKYRLSGGYIKNGVITAMNVALSRNGGGDFTLTQDDLDRGARLQERHLGSVNLFVERIQPAKTIADLVLPDAMRQKLEEVVAIARHCREASRPAHLGASVNGGFKVLFFGLSPALIMDAAEAVASELGISIGRIALDKLLSKNDMSESANHTFVDSAIMEAFASAHATGELLLFHDRTGDLGNPQESRIAQNTEFLVQFRKYDGIVIVVSGARIVTRDHLRAFHVALRFDALSSKERLACWKEATIGLPVAGDVDLSEVAEKYAITMEEIHDALHIASLHRAATPSAAIDMTILENALKQVSSGDLLQAELFGG